jgi:hypothetical protein
MLSFSKIAVSKKALRHQAQIASLSLVSAPSAAADPVEQQWLVKKLRATKMFGVVFGVLFVCLAPSVVARAFSSSLPREVVSYSYVLLLLNSVLNTPIYLAMNAPFRHAAKRLFCRCLQRRYHAHSSSSFPLRTVTVPVPHGETTQ